MQFDILMIWLQSKLFIIYTSSQHKTSYFDFAALKSTSNEPSKDTVLWLEKYAPKNEVQNNSQNNFQIPGLEIEKKLKLKIYSHPAFGDGFFRVSSNHNFATAMEVLVARAVQRLF